MTIINVVLCFLSVVRMYKTIGKSLEEAMGKVEEELFSCFFYKSWWKELQEGQIL